MIISGSFASMCIYAILKYYTPKGIPWAAIAIFKSLPGQFLSWGLNQEQQRRSKGPSQEQIVKAATDGVEGLKLDPADNLTYDEIIYQNNVA